MVTEGAKTSRAEQPNSEHCRDDCGSDCCRSSRRRRSEPRDYETARHLVAAERPEIAPKDTLADFARRYIEAFGEDRVRNDRTGDSRCRPGERTSRSARDGTVAPAVPTSRAVLV